MDATVHEGKHEPLMAEMASKLYALSCKPFGGSFDSFEVFDPKQGSWSLLPEFPRSGYWFSYAIAGTKLFVSVQNHPVFCFDVAADPSKQEWTKVPSMCRGGPFPFQGKALVLDLPHHNKKKLMFTAMNYDDYGRRPRLLVYLMSLYENRETITPIHELKLRELPPGEPRDYHFLHLGGHNVCLVITSFRNPDDYDELNEPGTHNIRGAAIPFQFEFDISKVDQDKKNCFTVQFLPPRIYEYHTNPSSTPLPQTDEKVITIRPSQLCSKDATSVKRSSSIRLIEYSVNTLFPPSKRETKRPLVVDRIIELFQNEMGSPPLPPNRVIDVKQFDGIMIVHDTSDKTGLLDYLEATGRGNCVICMDDFEHGSDASRLPCLHIFHGLCIVNWLRRYPNCPIFRDPIPPKWITWF